MVSVRRGPRRGPTRRSNPRGVGENRHEASRFGPLCPARQHESARAGPATPRFAARALHKPGSGRRARTLEFAALLVLSSGSAVLGSACSLARVLLLLGAVRAGPRGRLGARESGLWKRALGPGGRP